MWLGLALSVFGAAIGVFVWSYLVGAAPDPFGEQLTLVVAFTSFFAVGAAIVMRRPEHAIGWLFLVTGVYPLAQEALVRVGGWQMARGGSGALVVLANTVFSWPALLGIVVVFVPLLFPTGHLPSPGWRWLAWPAGTAMGVMAVGGLFQRDVCLAYDDPVGCVERVDNPIGLPWIVDLEESAFGDVMFGLLAVSMVASGVSVLVRYRRSRGVERVQLRWVAFAMGLFLAQVLIIGVLLEEVLEISFDPSSLPLGIDPFGLFLALVPISVGIAILRYRLYDIDRIISRTVGYGLLSAVLLSAYAGVVFLLGRLLPDQSDLAVAASTLAVAALFNPVRRRVQAGVDRRFNRTRYDSQRVVEGFGVRLRSEAGLEGLSRDLVAVAGTTMQPAWASLWLKEPTR